MPRQTNLTPAIQKAIAASVRKGNSFKDACELSGVPEHTGKEWLARGRGTDGDRDSIEPYATFATSIKRAEIEFKQKSIAQICKAGRGYKHKKIKQYHDREGEPVEEVTVEDRFSWQAAAWYLERKYPHEWGAKRMSELEALKVLVDAGWIPQSVLEEAIDGISDTRARVQARLGDARTE